MSEKIHPLWRGFNKISGAITGLLLMAPMLNAEELELSSWLPPEHPFVQKAILPWTEQVAEVTEGRVRITVTHDHPHAAHEQFDLAADGIVDLSYSKHSFESETRFLRSRVGEFSFTGDSAEATSLAYFQIYGEMLDAQQEHEGTTLLSLWTHGPGMLHLSGVAFTDIASFQDLRVRVPGGYIEDMLTLLGADTTKIMPGDVHEALTSEQINAMVLPSEALYDFALSPHVDRALSFSGGLYNTGWFLVMNDDSWAAIDPKDRAQIELISGKAFAQLAGRVWDEADMIGLMDAMDHGVEVELAPEAVMAPLRAMAARKEAKWRDRVEALGYDGAGALAAFRREIADWEAARRGG